MFGKIAVVFVAGILGWAYNAIRPPPPKICGSPDGPPVTSPRIRLSDGRHLAYIERGVPKEKAKYKIIIIHGFDNSKDFNLPASQELVEELGIYLLSYDRAGYGESDPNPKRSVKSDAFDIQELADQLELGSKFYIMGLSMGACSAWSCIKHLPHRIAGVALVVPVVNFWWSSLPANLTGLGFKRLLVQDQWVLRVAHYAPQLLYWWLTQKWFPSLATLEGNPAVLSSHDKEIVSKMMEGTPQPVQDKTRQQGVFESLHRDLMVVFGNWGFDPMDLNNPFPHNENCVHIWQGYEDRFVPFFLQRHLSERLPWIQYHEVPSGGHLFVYETVYADAILRGLFLGEVPSVI